MAAEPNRHVAHCGASHPAANAQKLIDRARSLIAIDWSGSASIPAQRKHIVIAECVLSPSARIQTIHITSSRTREETIAWLVAKAKQTPALVVGLDFAFSCPAWFVKAQQCATIEDFWRIVSTHGEQWLTDCTNPFWGRPAKQCPPDQRAPNRLGYRQADLLSSKGTQPKSPFQIGGAGAVGTGSLRGMPHLLTLREAGFSIWPFHPASLPMAMEIYPRTFTGPVNKSSRSARETYLATHFARLNTNSAEALKSATESEDAFDALCSAAGMAQQQERIAQLAPATDDITQLEGSIFPALPLQPL